MGTATTELVEIEEADTHVTVRLNRPDSLNALNADLVEAFHGAMERVSRDPEKGLLLTGAGRATCAGMDREMVSHPNYREEFSEVDSMNEEARELLRDYPYPTVMAVKGAAVGAGFLLSVVCDLVVLGEETHYSYPEVEYDLVAPTADLERLVGPRLAKEIQLTGDPIDPERAREIGLANELVPEDEVDGVARDLIGRIGEHDPEVVREIVADYRSRA